MAYWLPWAAFRRERDRVTRQRDGAGRCPGTAMMKADVRQGRSQSPRSLRWPSNSGPGILHQVNHMPQVLMVVAQRSSRSREFAGVSAESWLPVNKDRFSVKAHQ